MIAKKKIVSFMLVAVSGCFLGATAFGGYVDAKGKFHDASSCDHYAKSDCGKDKKHCKWDTKANKCVKTRKMVGSVRTIGQGKEKF